MKARNGDGVGNSLGGDPGWNPEIARQAVTVVDSTARKERIPPIKTESFYGWKKDAKKDLSVICTNRELKVRLAVIGPKRRKDRRQSVFLCVSFILNGGQRKNSSMFSSSWRETLYSKLYGSLRGPHLTVVTKSHLDLGPVFLSIPTSVIVG